jgi:hypothetical protein
MEFTMFCKASSILMYPVRDFCDFLTFCLSVYVGFFCIGVIFFFYVIFFFFLTQGLMLARQVF